MRKLLILLLLGIFFINSVVALDCQYKINESYEVEEEWFYFNGDFEGANLNMNEMVSVVNNHLSFIIYNNLTIPIKINLTYRIKSGFYGLDYPVSAEIDVDPRSSAGYDDGHVNTISNGPIYVTDLKYVLLYPVVTSEYKNVDKKREVCKLCLGQICLNDGNSCNPLYDSEKCGSGICNIAGFCGQKKVVDCSNGKLNCQDKICLESSTKEEGEAFMCSFECKSDRFENGTCLKSSLVLQKEIDERNKKLIIFGSIILIVFSILVGKFAVLPYIKRRREEEEKRRDAEKQREEEEKRRDYAKEEYKEIIARKEEVKKEIEENNQILEDLQQERVKTEWSLVSEKEKSKKRIEEIKIKEIEEIKKWENKKKNKSTEAKKVIDEEIAEVRVKRKNEIESVEKDFEKTKDTLIYQIEENKRLSLEEERKKREKEETIKKIENLKKLMNEFHLNDQRFRVRLNEKGYEILENGTPFHLFWYCKNSNEKQKDLDDFEIHHIDGDKWNNDYSNLIKLDKFTHKDIHEHNTRWIGYRKGVEILNRYKIKLPERVVEELEKIEKRASINARKSGLKRRG